MLSGNLRWVVGLGTFLCCGLLSYYHFDPFSRALPPAVSPACGPPHCCQLVPGTLQWQLTGSPAVQSYADEAGGRWEAGQLRADDVGLSVLAGRWIYWLGDSTLRQLLHDWLVRAGTKTDSYGSEGEGTYSLTRTLAAVASGLTGLPWLQRVNLD